ncbi:unnamed protein product [Ophioblennius macclurei]
MTEDTAAASPAKVARKRAPRSRKAGTPLSKLIVDAVASNKSRKGMSTQAIKKYLASKGVDLSKMNTRINLALVRLVKNEVLKQVSGVGASGSYTLNKKALKAKEDGKKKTTKATKTKKETKAKKPRVTKPKKSSTGKKKPTAKTAKSTPTKKVTAKKNAAKKNTKKTTTKKSSAKSTTPKRTPAKKRTSAGKVKKSGSAKKATPKRTGTKARGKR